MEKRVYVIGHRNPDTDSVVSAAAYARLKQTQGLANCFPARAGKINPQTEYIFNRFSVPVPEYLPDLIPKVAYYLSEPAVTIGEDVSLWEALDKLQKDSLRVLPIVNQNGIYKSMLHYRGFARYIMNNITPQGKAEFPISIDHLINSLHAQPLTVFNSREVLKSTIIVGAASDEFFMQRVDETDDLTQVLVIVGNREKIQRYSIERKVRALILTNWTTLDDELIALAKKNQVSVMVSPFDTSSTAMLILYSVPVGSIGDDSAALVRLNDPVQKIREPISNAPSRCLAVGDEEGRVAGLIFEGDLIKKPRIELIMVDHNEPSQAIEGIEHYKILEVIDHHRLGNLSTRYPITFINRVVGATCTIITNLYREQRIALDKKIASLLLCGILADTLSLHSATTTDVDREAAEYLSSITGLAIDVLGQELKDATDKGNALPAEALIDMDLKVYTERGKEYSVSQVETETPTNLVARKEELFSALEKVCTAEARLFAALLVTDVTTLDSLLFVAGDKMFINHINFPVVEDRIYVLKGVVSRKKQLIPLLSELLEKNLRSA
jgi:manganese-dependent inorganic pyrophosphatase